MEIKKLAETLEEIKLTKEDNSEYWHARDLWTLLGYTRWGNFLPSLERAKESCRTSGFVVQDHFLHAKKMVNLGSGSQREIEDYELTRYACYLIAQNGDPRIPEIAFAQMYFAIQARKQELVAEQIEEIERLIARKRLAETDREFAGNVLSRDVDRSSLAEIISVGDYVLFGSNSTKDMKKKLHITVKGRALADFLPTITLKAKDLAAEATTFNTKQKNLVGKEMIKEEHIKSNKSARGFLLNLDIFPEALPPVEDIKKVERRHQRQIKIASRAPKINLKEIESEELIIEIPEGTDTTQLKEMKELFLNNPGKGTVTLQLKDRKIRIELKVNLTKNVFMRVMEILNASHYPQED
jgi:DNA-damage-inducible protein D